MVGENVPLDRAQWKRFVQKGGRCLVCGKTAAVAVTLTARELTGERGGPNLASETIQFCHEHGIQRYSDSLGKLRGTAVIR